MVQSGTEFIELDAASPTLPPAAHDAPTQPSLRKPAPLAVAVARIRYALPPIDLSGPVGPVWAVLIWAAVIFFLGALVTTLAYSTLDSWEWSPNVGQVLPLGVRSAPASTATLSFAPLVHVGLETLTPTTPAGRSPTPRAPGRPSLLVPTPAK